MSELRIRGEETALRIVNPADGTLLTEVTAVKSWDFESRQRILKESYLGETSMRHDEIYDECGGSVPFHVEGVAAIRLINFLRQRAQRRSPQFNIALSLTFILNFTDGSRVRITIVDPKFETPPLKSPGRDQYVDITLTFAAAAYKISGI